MEISTKDNKSIKAKEIHKQAGIKKTKSFCTLKKLITFLAGFLHLLLDEKNPLKKIPSEGA